MDNLTNVSKNDQLRALILSTVAFTVCFAIWTVFSIIGIKIKQNLGLNDTEFGILVAMPILTGSISRVFLGIWSDRFGGRLIFTLVMLASAGSTWLLVDVHTYGFYLLAALGIGLAGGSFATGIAYVSRWYPAEEQGTVLGIFGAGNIGAAVTHFAAPLLLVVFGWQGVARVYAVALLIMAIIFWFFTKDDPSLAHRRKSKQKLPTLAEQLAPLKHMQVWRFSFYYAFSFGAFVALALWLPRYYVSVYKLSIPVAGLLTAFAYTLPGSVFRALGGYLSDKMGARRIMYFMFIVSAICTFLLAYPPTDYVVHGIRGSFSFSLAMGLAPFSILMFILGFVMSFGKAAVYKHIPVYYPDHVGSVGGVVGLIGGLGGFILPIVFGVMDDLTGLWTSCFMLLFLLSIVSLTWMHFAILGMEEKAAEDDDVVAR